MRSRGRQTSARQREPQLKTTRELSPPLVQLVSEAESLDDVFDRIGVAGHRHPVDGCLVVEIAAQRSVPRRQDLRNVRDLLTNPRPPRRRSIRVERWEADHAALRLQLSSENAEQRRLAVGIASYDTGDLPVTNRERHTAERESTTLVRSRQVAAFENDCFRHFDGQRARARGIHDVAARGRPRHRHRLLVSGKVGENRERSIDLLTRRFFLGAPQLTLEQYRPRHKTFDREHRR